MKLAKVAAALAVGLPALAGCYSDQSLNPPALNNPMFRRYIAIGTSISAGFQSLGWNDSTQKRAFPVLFAAAAGAPFAYPQFAARGCPPPLVTNAPLSRPPGTDATTCDLRSTPVPSYLNSLAVPGVTLIGALDNDSTSLATDPTYLALTTFVLGGSTEINRMRQAQPTFVSVELGADDVLGALIDTTNPGNVLAITDTTVFKARYDRILDSVDATGAAAILSTVPDVTNLGFASFGSIYWCLKNAPACGFSPPAPFPANFTVTVACAPQVAVPTSRGDSILVPWSVGIRKLLTAAQGLAQTLDCGDDLQVVTPTEFAAMRTATAAFNTHIQTQATQRGYALVDANQVLGGLRATGAILPFPDLSAVATSGLINFGTGLSLDGFHPSSSTHKIIADSIASAVNQKYGTSVIGP